VRTTPTARHPGRPFGSGPTQQDEFTTAQHVISGLIGGGENVGEPNVGEVLQFVTDRPEFLASVPMI
jgi:hypothetical protein